MHSRRVGDLAGERVLLEIDHHNLCRMREVQSTRIGIDIEDIPSTFAADGNLAGKLIILLRGRGAQQDKEISKREKNRAHSNFYSSNSKGASCRVPIGIP